MGTYAVQLCGEVLDAAEYPPPVDKSTFAAAMSDFLHGMQEVRGSNPLSSTFPQVMGTLRS
jgi:hypothetical protein